MSHAWVFPVNTGVNTFGIRILRQNGNGQLWAVDGELATIYSPFGSTGAGTIISAEETATSKTPNGD